MDKSIRIATFNIRGGMANWLKANRLYEFVMLYNIKIIILQETHLNSVEDALKFGKVFKNFKFNYIKCENKTKGVAILIENELIPNGVEFSNFYEERFF